MNGSPFDFDVLCLKALGYDGYDLLQVMMDDYHLAPVEYHGAWFLIDEVLLEDEIYPESPWITRLDEFRLKAPHTLIPLYDCIAVDGCPKPSQYVMAGDVSTEDEFLNFTSGQFLKPQLLEKNSVKKIGGKNSLDDYL